MRSSIACIRCRRSKVKCVNNGVGTTCRSCENSGRECTYPPPAVTGAGSRRRDSLPGRADAYGDAERRQRPRKSTHTSAAATHLASTARDSPRPLLDALDSKLLTPEVWRELFDIFQIHYSADLPFLHLPSFLEPLRNNFSHPSGSTGDVRSEANATAAAAAAARPPASVEFLLAFLALTARFHPRLVAHHSPAAGGRPSNPLIASEYYASAAGERLAFGLVDNIKHDIQRTQATLMLGLHEWGMCRGAKAWLAVGVAIRMAQAMGLQYELDLDDEPLSRSVALHNEAERMGVQSGRKTSVTSGQSAEDLFIQQEIRRRTFWSCYIMDRYLSSGKYRPQMLHARELRIQLPASEESFLFGANVRTMMLGEEDKTVSGTGRAEVQNQRQQSVMLGTGTPEPNMAPSPSRSVTMHDADGDKGALETGSAEGLVSRYIKILEIYGKVIKWSCAGGRRVEEYPPWDSRSEFFGLRRLCHEFKASLPRQHTLTPQNTQVHVSMKRGTPYVLVHTVYLLCQIMLNREYVPFIPIRCSKPEGPLDPPTFPPDRVPRGFWEESARDCFKSAREIMDLVRTSQDWGALVETPIVGFAIYTVAFVGVYCINFPWMDPAGYMCTQPDPTGKSETARPGESKGFEAARKALEMIGHMRNKLHMADGWFKTINRMHKYFRRLKIDYRKNVQNIESSSDNGSPVSTRHLSLREGGVGGGLDEYMLITRSLNEFGNIDDHDTEMVDASHNDGRGLDGYDDSSAEATVKSEEAGERGDRVERVTSAPDSAKPNGGSWSAINAAPGAAANQQPSTALPTPSSGQFRSYEPYPQHHHHHTQPQSNSQASNGQPSQHESTYPHHHSNFRAPYSETPSAAGPPSLTSPATQSVTASTPSQSQPSPPYNRQAQPYGSWSAHNAPLAPMQAPPPPPPNAYSNGVSQHYSSHQPYHTGYPTPAHPGHGQTAMPHQQIPEIQHQQVFNPMGKEQWLDSIDTQLGGDDVAAFVDGGELAEWASISANQGFGGGWLSTVWQGGT